VTRALGLPIGTFRTGRSLLALAMGRRYRPAPTDDGGHDDVAADRRAA
jgi:hypothetical protein